ncbi:hypothetical protein EJ05DRAFT_475360 [Pseudovirgaria hyperparasitica]|uniref:DSC E3 ubiquitin ligase complex subunit A n=1 Tax=Pseudovirgaria hyperparasitica TaxID=470096 RepID=A0A6A6WAZ3_9PEZI|nr:uncharacterized protein EJ05DRAFT_475360 [Pseudovirgaria hyperparasitica]KAF2759130.1 hypothetical protein EJ05DRAFT_475360 [Pseudovirgaria hyperparasitica]
MADHNPRTLVLLILLIIYFTSTPETQHTTALFRLNSTEIVAKEYSELSVLNSTHHGDFDPVQEKWLGMPGLRKEDGFEWSLFRGVREKAYQQATYILGDRVRGALGNGLLAEQRPILYKNTTGSIYGDWKRSDIGKEIEHKPVNLSATAPDYYWVNGYDRNMSSSYGGTIEIEFTELDTDRTARNGSVREISAQIEVEDVSGLNAQWTAILHGIHYVNSGHVLLTTTSEKFAGIFALPHMALTNNMFAMAQDLLNDTIHREIQKHSGSLKHRAFIDPNPWSSVPGKVDEEGLSSPHCEYVLYLQQHLVEDQDVEIDYLDFVETELRYPTGAQLKQTPKLVYSMVAFSPDCGFVIESKGAPDTFTASSNHLQGYKKEARILAFRHVVEFLACIFVAQVFFLLRQMKDTSTPSTRHRVSYYSIWIIAMGDAFWSMCLLLFGLVHGSLFYTTFATFFLGFASVLHLSVRFILDIWSVQYTERLRQERQERNSRPVTADIPSQDMQNAEGLPLPGTTVQDTGATPIVLPSDQDVTAEAQVPSNPTTAESADANRQFMYMQFVLSMLVLFILTAFALSWPSIFRNAFLNILNFAYLSFWCPQIHRNVVRNCRKALRWDFIISQSALRLIPISYFYVVKDNVLFSTKDIHMMYVYLLWVWLQIFALLSQEHLGPRFFVPSSWVPPAYDYHPILREDEESMNLPIGSDQVADADVSSLPAKTGGESKEKGKRVYDCTICAQDVEVTIIPTGVSQDSLTTNLLTRRTYMVTPCRHIFHKPCLEGWMRFRLQCPNCREALPPL